MIDYINWRIDAHNMTENELDRLLKPYSKFGSFDGSYGAKLISILSLATTSGLESDVIFQCLAEYTSKHPKVYFEILLNYLNQDCPDKVVIHHGKACMFYGKVVYRYQGDLELKEDFRA